MTDAFGLASAIWLSLGVGLVSTFIALPIAVFFGFVMARFHFFGKSFVNLLLFVPLTTPPVVTGLLLLEILGRHSILGQILGKFNIEIPFTFSAAVIAAIVVGLPLFISATRHAFEATNRHLEEAAQVDGCTYMQSIFRVTFPLALPGIAAGAVLAFARALGEFGATAIFAGSIEGQTQTIPLAIYALMESPDGLQRSQPLIVASLVISFMSLLSYNLLLHRHRKMSE